MKIVQDENLKTCRVNPVGDLLQLSGKFEFVSKCIINMRHFDEYLLKASYEGNYDTGMIYCVRDSVGHIVCRSQNDRNDFHFDLHYEAPSICQKFVMEILDELNISYKTIRKV